MCKIAGGWQSARVNAIEVDDLRVTYTPRRAAAVEAVRGVSFAVGEGEIFGLLGPNGAGKTSTLEVCEGFRAPTSGSVRVLGQDPRASDLRSRVGVVLQDIAVEPFLTVREVIARNAYYYARPRTVPEVLSLVGLTDKADVQVKRLSGGQLRRLDLGLGIVGRPALLFLDEPTTGFDPGARRGAWDVVRGLKDEGTTVVLTTHYLDEAEALADRVVVVAAGQVVAEGSPRELAAAGPQASRIRFRAQAAELPELNGDVTFAGDLVSVATAQPTEVLHRLTGWALDRGEPLTDLTVDRASFEDVYLALTEEQA